MKPSGPVAPKDAFVAVSAGLLAALLFWGLLNWFSAPHAFDGRLERLSTQGAALMKTTRNVRTQGAVGSVCQSPVTKQANLLAKSLPQLAVRNRVELSSLSAEPEEPNSGGASVLAPVRLQFTASGAYEGVMAMLDSLSRNQPKIFVDTVDFTSNVSSVELRFSGRVFCAA